MAKILIDCAICRGTGSRDADRKPPVCSICDGIGKLWVEEPFIQCNMCRGTGSRDRDYRPPICGICRGAGVVPLDRINSI